MNQCPQAPKYSIGAVLNFFENTRYNRKWIYNKLFSSVNDTGKKFIAGVSHGEITKKPKIFACVNDTAEKLFTGVNDTGD